MKLAAIPTAAALNFPDESVDEAVKFWNPTCLSAVHWWQPSCR